MHSGFGGTHFGDAYELDDQEKLTFRLRKRVRTKLGHDGVEFQKRRFGLLDLLLPAAILLLFSCVCFGQSTFGTIRGTVQDGSGSVLPDTTVVVHSTAENTDCNSSTDAVGEFNFENVKPGAYRDGSPSRLQ
ncbi:carboxypeptidase family protein [Edaphobacter modestus]|uniref:Carboxypeptidase family protein n=1 Tax=Edaphobacter modestus TaxID=388466 RepID=A0A4Q7YXW5_9BACT|nr:carboxypeptidase family protein [Edaphobacter modestus]